MSDVLRDLLKAFEAFAASQRTSILDKLLFADTHAPVEARRVLAAFDPWLSTALDEVADIYVDLFKAIGASGLPLQVERTLDTVAAELSLDRAALIELIRSGDTRPRLVEVGRLYRMYRAMDVAGLLFTLCGRYFRWMATDLLRGRVTAAIGYVRLQSEAVALVHLFAETPEEAEAWFVAGTSGDGLAFYKRTQNRVRALVKELHLGDAYEWGSSHAMHVRIPPVLRAHVIEREGRERPYLWLKDHEFDAESPLHFLDATIRILHVQALVLKALQRVRSDADTGGIVPRLAKYAESVKRVGLAVIELGLRDRPGSRAVQRGDRWHIR